MHEPRTLFATTAQGDTLILRRFDSPDQPPSHEVSVYRGYLTPSPAEVPLPRGFPERFPSREQALVRVRQEWKLEPDAFQDVRLGRRVAIDFVRALRQGTLEPLHAEMSAEALVALLGVPEGVTPLFEPGCVCWFYGSVQLHLRGGTLWFLEVDRGEGDFTSLQLEGWFLGGATTRTQLKHALESRSVPYAEEPHLDTQVLRLRGPHPRRGFTFDFDEEDERIHAFYWNV
jgi:hypothetical protein